MLLSPRLDIKSIRRKTKDLFLKKKKKFNKYGNIGSCLMRDKTQYEILAYGRALEFWKMNEPSEKKNDNQLYEISWKDT